MKRTKTKLLIYFICIVLVAVFLVDKNGYSFSESRAIKKSFPFENGFIVYEESFDNNKVIFWKGQTRTYVKLLKWNILHKVNSVATLSPIYPDETIKRTWTANLNSNKQYNTMLAVEVSDPKIKKVVITNENIDNEILNDLTEIKKESNLFIELNLIDGYGAAYEELAPKDAGGFVFRGIDDEGIIKYVGR